MLYFFFFAASKVGPSGTQQPQNTLSISDSFLSLPTSSDDETFCEHYGNNFEVKIIMKCLWQWY
jgi:hypothetical protein